LSKDSEDRQVWEKIWELIKINFSILFTIIVWLGLFISMLIGYFSIPLVVIVVVVTYLAIRETFFKKNDENK
jgi:hypothetical protein